VGGGAEGDEGAGLVALSKTSVRAKKTLRPAVTTRPSAERRRPMRAWPVKRQSRSSVTARRTRPGKGQNSPAKAAAWSIIESSTPPWTMPERLAWCSTVSQTSLA
jgi:hypothetical protein